MRLNKRVYAFGNRSRRSKLTVYDVAEKKGYTSKDLSIRRNYTIIKDILELEPVVIKRISRMGKPGQKKTTPLFCKLFH